MRAKKINKGERSLKKVHRDKNKEKREKEVEYEEQDISVSSRMEEEIPEEMIQNYESPEDVKLKIAKKIIEKAQMSVKKHKEKEGDDFFLAD